MDGRQLSPSGISGTNQVALRCPETGAVTVEGATRMASRWPLLLNSPLRDERQAVELREGIAALSEPANHTWLMARIAALLHPYYAGSAAAGAVKMMAEDWAYALGGYPEWAVTKAVRWWKSADNPERKRKPLEGDIAAICKREMGVVKVAEGALSRWDERPEVGDEEDYPGKGVRVTPEQAAAIRAKYDVPDIPIKRMQMADNAAQSMKRAGFGEEDTGQGKDE